MQHRALAGINRFCDEPAVDYKHIFPPTSGIGITSAELNQALYLKYSQSSNMHKY